MSIENFQACLKEILKHEGGFVNHPQDPGGMTNLGVTKAVYESYVGRAVDEKTMRGLTPGTVAPLYKRLYWDKLRCEDLPLGLDLCVFDFGVNAGVSRASKFLQRMIGAVDDGVIGPATVRKTIEYVQTNGNEGAIKKYQESRRAYYQRLPTFGTFGKGWLRRVNEVERKAIDML